MTTTLSNRIEQQVFVRAPSSRVWRAITTPREFGQWFRAALEGEITPGARIDAVSTHESCEGVRFHMIIDRVEPERLFSWRWHPGMPRPDVDYSKEPMTTVTFRLEEQEDGTLVTVEESGFEAIPLSRRAEVFRDNEGGWKEQMGSLANYVGSTS